MTGYLFAALFFGCLVLSLVRHPRWGMYAYMAAFYVFPPSRWWGASLPDFRWSLLASAVFFVSLLRYPRSPHQPPWLSTTPARLLLAFTAIVWIQNLWALDSDQNMLFSVLYTKYLLLYYMLYRLSDSTENVRHILLAHVAGCLYLGWLAYGTPVDSDRLDGVGGPGINDSNTLGMQFASAVPCGAMLVLIERNWRLILALASLAFSMNGLVMCGSRGAFLSMIAGTGSLVFTHPRKYRKWFTILALCGVVGFSMVASATFWKRMDTMQGAVKEDAAPLDNSAESRFYIVQAQFQMLETHPFGLGHRGTASLSRAYIAEKYLSRNEKGEYGERASHNTFMSALVEHGFAGALIFIWICVWCRKAAREARSKLQDIAPMATSYVAAVYGALITILIAGLFADFLAVEVTIWMLAILASMHGIARQNAAAFAIEAEPQPRSRPVLTSPVGAATRQPRP